VAYKNIAKTLKTYLSTKSLNTSRRIELSIKRTSRSSGILKPQIQLCLSPRPSYTQRAAVTPVRPRPELKTGGKMSVHTTTPPNIQKPNRDTDLSYPTTLPGVSSGTKPDQTPLSATHPHAGTQPRSAFPRPQPRLRRRPRASATAAHPPNGHRPQRPQAAAPDDPKNKTNKPPPGKRERAQHKAAGPLSPSSHYSPLDPPPAAPAQPAAAPGRRSSRRERGGRPVAPVSAGE